MSLQEKSAPILVTGGAGFIGSNFVLEWLAAGAGPLVNLDKLTYAGNPENLASVEADPKYTFVQGCPSAHFNLTGVSVRKGRFSHADEDQERSSGALAPARQGTQTRLGETWLPRVTFLSGPWRTSAN